MCNIFLDICKIFKYFIYFNFFLTILIINLINYKITRQFNEKWILWLHYTINLNGCILIKIVQWFNTNLELLQMKDTKILYNIFSSFYENCSIHDINYTKKVFKNDFDNNFDDIIELDNDFTIKSGSIAQIYKAFYKNTQVALKVVHPDIEYQMIFPIMYLKLYKFLVTNICFLNKYDTVFIFDNFFENLRNQSNMHIEFNNMEYYYERYYNNDYILIPKPICASVNILIMEFIDGEKFDSMETSLLDKQKIIGLLTLFIKDNFYFQDYYHSDLHESNWKVIKYKDFYKLVIYDYGYISTNNSHLQQTFKDLSYYNDILDVESIIDILYKNCSVKNLTHKDFKLKFVKYLNELEYEWREPFCDEVILRMYNFLFLYNIHLNANVFELFIGMILFKKYVIKYLYIKKIGTSTSNLLVSMYLNSINICNKYNIFIDVRNYYQEIYINNPEIKNTYIFNNKYLENLHGEDSIDI